MLKSPYKKPYITPPKEHPRVMFKECDRKRITDNFVHPENRRAYELWQRVCKKDFCDFYDDIKTGKYNLMVCFMLEAKAFEAWIDKDKAKARYVIDVAKKILTLFSTDRNTNLMLCRHTGHLVFVVSCVYDWLYSYLTQDEKEYIISRCEELLAASMEVGYPPVRQRDIHSHAHEAQLLRDMLAFSIAVYDERPDIYDFVAGRIIDDLVPFYKFAFQTELHNQGPSYGAYRHVCAFWAQLIFYAMSGQKIFDKCIEDAADGYYYLTRADGENLRIGNDCHDDKGGSIAIKHPFTVVNFFAAALTGNEHYKKYYLENFCDEIMLPTYYGIDFYKNGIYGEGLYSPVVHLVFNRLTASQEPKPYPKARYFAYPAGTTIYKDEENKTTVYMKIGELFCSGHEHYDMGNFQIYHKGILASSSGAYYYYGNYHFYNYDTRTSSHNCLTIRDPNVKTLGKVDSCGEMIDIINDGGTRMPQQTTDYSFEPDIAAAWQRDFNMAKVLSHTESDELVEIEGDLTQAYSHTCDKVIRKMSFEPKKSKYGVFTVFDRVKAKSEDFIKCFHIHTMAEPVICGNEITIEHKGGKLKCKVIEPANASIIALGGGENRFTLNGEPIFCDEEKTKNRECGWGKIIISPTDKAKAHTFKVQFEILDSEI